MNPAECLVGLNLDRGWLVTSKVTRRPNSTGGFFSVCYLVENSDGRKCFLKAIDFSAALQAPDFSTALEELARAYNFERNLLNKCKDQTLRRIVTPIDDGSVVVVGNPSPLNKVSYLIFEKAEGDVRNQQALLDGFDLAWCMRSLHHVTTGLRQLHQKGIAHQDLKPSNVLEFSDQGFKIADLGRATDKNVSADHDSFKVPGDPTYAAPDLFYDVPGVNGFEKRQASDLYHLGSLTFFFFSALPITTAVRLKLLNGPLGIQLTGADFDSDLPILQNAFGEVLQDLYPILQEKAGVLAPEIHSILRELCEPDPRVRGDKREQFFKHVGRFNLERYISGFDNLAIRAERIFG